MSLPAAAADRRNVLAGFVSAVVFGVGLVVSGMTRPEKVAGFLDPTGAWDPSLAFVMVGAIAVHAVLYRLVRRRRSPLFAGSFSVPTRRDIDPRLVVGAALFGAGWGLGGICPGPGLVAVPRALVDGAWPIVAFAVSMLVGMKAFSVWNAWTERKG